MTSIQRATTLLMKLKPYKIPVVHTLQQPDPNKRLRFCNWVLEKVNSGELDAKDFFFFFSDEAWFYVRGQVCSQNYRYYSDWKTERVFGSSGGLTPREAAGRPGKAASNSRLYARIVFGWLCTIMFYARLFFSKEKKLVEYLCWLLYVNCISCSHIIVK